MEAFNQTQTHKVTVTTMESYDNSFNKFNLEMAMVLSQSEDQFPVDFDDAWKWLGYSNKSHAKRAFDNLGYIEGEDYLREVVKTPEGDEYSTEVWRTSEEYLSEMKRINSPGQPNVGFSPFMVKTPNVGRPSHSIRLTVDAFKKWGMRANNVQGEQIRIYFIQCEAKLKQMQSAEDMPLEEQMFLLSQTYLKVYQQNKLLGSQVAELAPKAEVFDDFISKEGCATREQFCKDLGFPYPKRFCQWLFNMKYLFVEGKNVKPFAEYNEFFVLKPTLITTKVQNLRMTAYQLVITAKGIEWLTPQLKANWGEVAATACKTPERKVKVSAK